MAGNRRNFLKKAGGVTALVAAAPLGSVLSEPGVTVRTAAAVELTPTGSFALELEGKPAGHLISSTGGMPVAAVVEEATIPGQFTKKHLGEISYQPIDLQCSVDLDTELLDWLVESLTPGKPAYRDGAIQAADFNGNVVSERNFFNALVSEVGFPAMDGASRDAGLMEVRILPESTAVAAGGGTFPPTPRPKVWLASNFRFSLGGLPTSRVSRIESFSISIEAVGGGPAGTTAHVPDLRVTFSAIDAGPWQAFFDDFVLNGNNGPASELTGKIELLTPDISEVILAVELGHVGIFGLAPATSEESLISRFVADLYAEEISLTVPGTA